MLSLHCVIDILDVKYPTFVDGIAEIYDELFHTIGYFAWFHSLLIAMPVAIAVPILHDSVFINKARNDDIQGRAWRTLLARGHIVALAYL